MQQQVCQFSALLYQMNVGKPRHPVAESLDAQQLAQDQAGIVKTQSLIEIANQ